MQEGSDSVMDPRVSLKWHQLHLSVSTYSGNMYKNVFDLSVALTFDPDHPKGNLVWPVQDDHPLDLSVKSLRLYVENMSVLTALWL